MSTLIQDLHYGLRTLAKNPGFTAVAVVTWAAGGAQDTSRRPQKGSALVARPTKTAAKARRPRAARQSSSLLECGKDIPVPV